MDAVHKERLQEEAKQRTLGEILHKYGSLTADAMKDEVLTTLGSVVEAGTIKSFVMQIWEIAMETEEAQPRLAEMSGLMPATFEPPESEAAPKEKGAGSRNTSSASKVDFRLMMIKKCKEELQEGTSAQKSIKQWEAKQETMGKEKLKGDDKVAYDAAKAARARHYVASTFIAHLYCQGIATDKVIQSAMEALLKSEAHPSEDDISRLCTLCKLVGGKLENPTTSRSSRDGKLVDGYFAKIQKMKDDAISKDVAKRLGEVLDLRGSGWKA